MVNHTSNKEPRFKRFGIFGLEDSAVINEAPETELSSRKGVEPKQNLSVETLAEIPSVLNSQDNLPIVLQEILKQAQHLVSYQAAYVLLLEGDNLRVVAWHTTYQAFDGKEIVTKRVQPLADFPSYAEIVRLKQPLLIADTSQEANWGVQDETNWVRSNLTLPINLSDRVLGLLSLDSAQPGAFSTEDIASMQPLVKIAAITLENAQLINQAQQEINQRRRVEEALQHRVEELKGAYKQATVYAQDLNEEINRRKRADEERRRLSAAIEQTAESMIITDIHGVILYVNPAFEHITGYSRSEVVGQTPRVLKSDQQDTPFYTDLWTTIKIGEVWKGHLVNRKKDGSPYTLDSTISPIRDKKGTITGYVQVGRDITHELQLEKQYLQAQKMEAIGRLAGGVAHDFNNLLTVITGFSEMIQSHLAADHPTQEYLDSILYSANHATDLVRQLLAFSRQQVVAPKVLNLNTVISNLDKTLGRLIGEDIRLETHLALDLWAVKVDPTQVEQVIFNLAVNALDAMPEGGQLVIETTNVVLDKNYRTDHFDVQPGEYVLLATSDTGIGMSEETQARLFEPFFTTKEAGKGTGLGLATVFGIVQQSNGHIRVYSEPGYGTTFKIYLPRVREIASLPKQQRQQTDHLPRGTEIVLLVEDEPKVRDLADRLLRRQGYTVLTAANGEEALVLGQTHKGEIHLLLTDMVMPHMNGKTLADQFRLHRPKIKVLFASGYTDKAIVQQGLLDSEVAFIQKPFSLAELTQKVRAVLDG